MHGLSRRTFAGMLAAAAPGSALPAPRAPALIRPPWAPPAWTGWQQVPGGGSTISAPAVSSNGLLHVVVRGLDDGIYYNIIQLSPLSLPGAAGARSPTGRTPSAPSAAAYDRLSDGLSLEVFVRDENSGIQSNPFDLAEDSWSGWSVVPGRG